MKIKKYIEQIVSKGKQEDMDKLSDMLSELIYMMKEPHNEMYKKYKMCLYEMANGKILDEDMAMEIVEKMKPYSQHWDMNTTTQVKKEYGLNDIRDIDFYVVMNSLYNDYHSVLEEDTEKYVKMAIAFIRDEDAEEGKIYTYFTHIPKRD